MEVRLTVKSLDRLLRTWRTRVALRKMPTGADAVLDIGCGDGHLLGSLRARREALIRRCPGFRGDGLSWFRMFPGDLARLGLRGPYDAVFALAVFEHLDDQELRAARAVLPELLKPGGRLIVTVPHPLVDRILDVLMLLRLIDGQAVEEHHGFDPGRLTELASGQVRLVSRSSFQLGLNNVFVFERNGLPCS
jgi:SAM-dependent methyltransferase